MKRIGNKLDGGKGKAKKRYHKALRNQGKQYILTLTKDGASRCFGPVSKDDLASMSLILTRDKQFKGWSLSSHELESSIPGWDT